MNRGTRERLNGIAWLRFLADRFVLLPMATWLPLPVALRVADTLGAVDSLLPVETTRQARLEIEAALGLQGSALRREVRRKLANPRRDLVWCQRMRHGKEHIDNWRLIETNEGPVHDLVPSHQSFIVAGGHFMDAATKARHKVLPVHGRSLSGAVPRWQFSPLELRRRLAEQVSHGARERFLGLTTGGATMPEIKAKIPDYWERQTDWTAIKQPTNAQEMLLAELARPGSVCQILVDAYWEKPGAYHRPFAGIAERGFAVGAARIARLAQCPIVPYVIVLDEEPRTVRIDWGDPIPPPPIDDRDSDRRVTDLALDFVERGVARYPTQYLLPMGWARHFDPAAAAWVSQ